MNILLAVITAAFGAAAGLYFSKRLKEREAVLSAVILLIRELTVQIRYTNSEIGKMLRSAAQNEEFKKLLFVTGCEEISEKGDFHKSWRSGAAMQPYLNTKDRELLLSLGEKLGSTDLDGQLSFLEMTEEIFKERQKQAFSDYLNKGRVYRSVGVLCGLAAGIIVL
ncbi:MAG: stage III sporulation protein AB [Firmicutes bacterium]|nr:stage III sporulation protein AB [[Eubacterium] siraeum]MCM1487394.1 stage III sporulation protein AB [Bacillota bacterium]